MAGGIMGKADMGLSKLIWPTDGVDFSVVVYPF